MSMSDSDNNQANAQFDQALVNRLAREFLAEQRRARRWNLFFRLFIVAFLSALLFIYLSKDDMPSVGVDDGRHTALIDVQGIIISGGQSGGIDYVSADHVAEGLRAAYADEGTAGIIIRIDSPGGSPVQAGRINDEINRLKGERPDLPVYAVIGDLCASGGYYIAVAADKIYADKASLVGSIGVISSGFGFVGALDKLGVERRVRHAGESKAFLDPFAPLREDELKHLDGLLDSIYQQFVETVKTGRGDRLADDERIFSGLVWTGEQSVELGLVDELGGVGYVAREVIGATAVVDFTQRDSWLDEFFVEWGALVSGKMKQKFRYFQYL